MKGVTRRGFLRLAGTMALGGLAATEASAQHWTYALTPRSDAFEAFGRRVAATVDKHWKNWQLHPRYQYDELYVATRGSHVVTQTESIASLWEATRDLPDGEIDAAIINWFETTIFRPRSRELVQNCRPVVTSAHTLELWCKDYADIEPQFPATRQISDDAVLTLRSSRDRPWTFLTNYDVEEISFDGALAIGLANSDDRLVDATFIALGPGQWEVSARRWYPGTSGLILSDTFWENVRESLPEAVYAALPFNDDRLFLIAKANARENLGLLLEAMEQEARPDLRRPIDCAWLEDMAARREGKPGNSNFDAASYLKKRAAQCNDQRRQQIAGMWPGTQFIPLSKHLYKYRDGKIIVVG